MVRAPLATGPTALLDDGTVIPLAPPVVLGRGPVPPADHADARPYPLDDPSRRLSQTHLVVGCDGQGAWLIDLHSTNGVAVARRPGDRLATVEPGRTVRLPVGARVVFGGRRIEIR